MKPYAHISSALFAIVSLAHLLRLIYGWNMNIGGWVVPMWISWVGFVVPGVLAVMIWREGRAG